MDGSCACFDGWSGVACEVRTCSDDCSTHGDCIDGKCFCKSGWRGESCKERIGCPDDCWASLGRGLCVGDPGVCACARGITGAGCSEVSPVAPAAMLAASICSEGQCGPHGACDADGKCVCEKGWHGDFCTLTACIPSPPGEPSPCGEHGACVDGLCRCALGYEVASIGLHCSRQCTTACSSPHGVCANGLCLCAAGRAGEDCSAVLCPSGCSGRGVCSDSGTCDCYSGFGGSDCSLELCASNCSGHGACALFPAPELAPSLQPPSRQAALRPVQRARCVCDLGWLGDACQYRACPAECSRHGACLSGGICACDAGWKGIDCATPRCPADARSADPDNECGGHGQCTPTGRCRCWPGWSGVACERPVCAGPDAVGTSTSLMSMEG